MNCKQDSQKKRDAYNITFLLYYCIVKSFKMKEPLITIVIHFKEALNTITRKSLVECINKFRMHPHTIDVIREMDQNDTTNLNPNTEMITNVQVTTGSSPLLLLFIILHFNLTQCGFRGEICCTPSLLYADDGTLLAQREEEATDRMNTLNRIRQNLHSTSQQGQKFGDNL